MEAAQRPAPAEDLPPLADSLLRYRQGGPRLRALAAGKTPPAGSLDLQLALDWLTQVVETLKLVDGLNEPGTFLFESLVVSGHDAEYSAAAVEFPKVLKAALQAVAPAARDLGNGLKTAVMDAVNASSVVKQDRSADPALPSKDQAIAWRVQSTALATLAKTADTGGAGLPEAALACEDGALALLQARSVVDARATWRSGAAQSSTLADIPKPKRARNEVDDIFADSGFGPRQSLREDGSRDDWCGMFAAASMFRGAALDQDVRLAFAHTNNVFDFFTYNPSPTNKGRTPRSVWADGQWWPLKEYHASRGLPRTWIEGAGAEDADIRPGDIALIRHQGVKTKVGIAQHIVMVESFDRATGKLVTIEGNVIEGIRPGDDGEAKRTKSGELASTSTATSSTAVEIRDLNDTKALTPGAAKDGSYQERGRKTIFGIGRPSLADFEHHEFGTDPVPEKYKYTSPDEIRRKGIGVELGKQTDEHSPATGPYHKRVGG